MPVMPLEATILILGSRFRSARTIATPSIRGIMMSVSTRLIFPPCLGEQGQILPRQLGCGHHVVTVPDQDPARDVADRALIIHEQYQLPPAMRQARVLRRCQVGQVALTVAGR